MFKTPWFDKALIRSDEGFSLRWGQDWATYNENERKLTFTIDVGGQGASIFVGSVTRWDDQPFHPVEPETQMRIVRNVQRALEWKGFQVELIP